MRKQKGVNREIANDDYVDISFQLLYTEKTVQTEYFYQEFFMKTKKRLATLGIIIGVVAIIIGFLTYSGEFSAGSIYPSSNKNYSSGYASFGADFYTYVSNNAADAANGAISAARNLNDISYLLQHVFGVMFIVFGLVDVCAFGIVRSGCPKKDKKKNENTVLNNAPAYYPYAGNTQSPVQPVNNFAAPVQDAVPPQAFVPEEQPVVYEVKPEETAAEETPAE